MNVQRQQLEYIIHHNTLKDDNIKWVMLMDDDTWFNWPQLEKLLTKLDPRDPVALSYILSDAQILGYDYPCGGAGMLMSR